MKKHILSAAFIIAAVSFAGCAKNMSNSNLTVQSDTTANAKWDTFADYVGMAHIENGPDLSNQAAVTEALSTPPANFQPAFDKNGNPTNEAGYKQVQEAVKDFVLAEAPNMQATKIVSIVPFNAGADSVDHSSDKSFISIPYFDRDGNTVDLSNIKTNSGLDAKGNFSVHQTINAKVTAATASGTVYLITYLLGTSTQQYQALVSIPSDASATKQYPLMMFAHGGDAGLTFREMATLLQANLGKFIVAAPVYPGEPICGVSFTEGIDANGYTRSCLDRDNKVTDPVVAPIGDKSPMKGDVDSLIALQNGIWQLASNNYKLEFYSGKNYFVDSSNNSIIPFYDTQLGDGIKTIGVADSRGGGTLMAAIGRLGFLMSINKAKPPLFVFSGAAFLYTPSSFLVGQFRFLTQYMMSGNVPSSFNALPMVPEMTHYFDGYRNAQAGSSDESTQLQDLVGFLGASDITFLAPYISVAVQNWSTDYFTQFSAMSMPGSIIFMHGTQDAIVPFTESLIAKTAMDQVFDNIYRSPANISPLVKGLVPAVGTQIYSFQPDESYYNVELGSAGCNNNLDSKGNFPVNYNQDNSKCFGGGYLGNGTVNTDHGLDAAFLTSRVENSTLQLQNFDSNSKASLGLKNELLYGVDPASDSNKCDPNDKSCDLTKKPYTFHVQFSSFETGVKTKYDIEDKYSKDICSNALQQQIPLPNGACYSMGYMSSSFATNSYPFYYRSIGEDSTNITANALLGVWDNDTQKNSKLTPTDLMTSWFDVSVLDSSQGVFASFN